MSPLVAEVIVTGENNGLTARIYPEKELADAKGMDADAVRNAIGQHHHARQHCVGIIRTFPCRFRTLFIGIGPVINICARISESTSGDSEKSSVIHLCRIPMVVPIIPAIR